MNLVEALRTSQMEHLLAINTVARDWPQRKEFLLHRIRSGSRDEFIKLGDHLSEAFLLRREDGRSQAGVSAAGVAWESLITWHINLCLKGTDAVCLRGNAFVPEAVKQSLQVSFSNKILRSESDVVIVAMPGASQILLPRTSRRAIKTSADEFCERAFDKIGLINIQCKTNWNDNAQVPMLWNMLYTQARKGAMITNGFCIGGSAYSLRGLGYFAYAFATVPTNGWQTYSVSDLCVLRAQTMSGGNYWGRPTMNGIARSISTVFSEFSKAPDIFPPSSSIAREVAEEYGAGKRDIFF